MRAPLRHSSKNLYVYLFSLGGEVNDQTRRHIATELDTNEETITNAARELEDAGFLSGTNRGQGHPKCYRCLKTTSEPISNSRESRFLESGKTDSSIQKAEKPIAQEAEKPTEPAHGLCQGEVVAVDVDPRASIDTAVQGVCFIDRIGKADPKKNLPENQRQNQNQPAPTPKWQWQQGDKRKGKPPERVRGLEALLWDEFGIPLGLEPLGPGGDQIAGFLLDSGLDDREIGRIVLYDVVPRLFKKGTKEPKRHGIGDWWHYIVKVFYGILAERRKPLQRETRAVEAEPMTMAVGQATGPPQRNGR